MGLLVNLGTPGGGPVKWVRTVRVGLSSSAAPIKAEGEGWQGSVGTINGHNNITLVLTASYRVNKFTT